MLSDFYRSCASCRWLVDDGCYKNGKYLCQECLNSAIVNYSYLTTNALYQIATDESKRMSHRYAATRELQKRRVRREDSDELLLKE